MRFLVIALSALVVGCSGGKSDTLFFASLAGLRDGFHAEIDEFISDGGDAYAWASFSDPKGAADSLAKEWGQLKLKGAQLDVIGSIRRPHDNAAAWFQVDVGAANCSKASEAVFPGNCREANVDSTLELWQGSVGGCAIATIVQKNGKGYVYLRAESGCKLAD